MASADPSKCQLADGVQTCETSDRKTAVIICPGGGYAILAAGHEEAPTSPGFNDWGITRRLCSTGLRTIQSWLTNPSAPWDAQRGAATGARTCRGMGVDPGRIGIMGFSAGARPPWLPHNYRLSTIETFPFAGFFHLVYPVISFSDSLVHIGSRNNLLGKTPTGGWITAFSNERQVTEQTPLSGSCGRRWRVKVETPIITRPRAMSELHVYPHGGHGFGLYNKPHLITGLKAACNTGWWPAAGSEESVEGETWPPACKPLPTDGRDAGIRGRGAAGCAYFQTTPLHFERDQSLFHRHGSYGYPVVLAVKQDGHLPGFRLHDIAELPWTIR